MKIIDEMFQGKNVSMQIDDNGVLWFEWLLFIVVTFLF